MSLRKPPPTRGAPTSTEAHLSLVPAAFRRVASVTPRSRSLRYVAGVLLLAAAYYGAAKLGQTLRYTASVAAIWPPAGLGIAALYLWGIRLWPGVLLGELIVNAELLVHDPAFPTASLAGQQAGNMAEIIVGALLLRRLVGPRAAIDRVEQVRGMLVALAVAAAISATVGAVSMIAGGVVDAADATEFWRTWWLGDTSGGLVVVPLMLAWAHDPIAAWRRVRTVEGVALIASVTALTIVAFSTQEPIRYTVFPALIWAAFRLGPQGATLSIAISSVVAIGVTANDVGPFFQQPIDHRTLNTQLYIWVAALTPLFLSGVVSERERASAALADARRSEGERALEQRRRIARDLHDSVSQALISELHRDPVHDGLVAALTRHAAGLRTTGGLTIDVRGPEARLPLCGLVEAQLFAIGREALANVQKHAGVSTAHVRVEERDGEVVLEVRDNGRGFDPDADHPGHFGLDSMRSRATEIGACMTITSAAGSGTLVRVRVPAHAA